MAYVPNPQNIPPYDGSGAKLILSVSNPTIAVTYKIGVHVQTITTTAPTTGPFDWGYVSGAGISHFVDDGGIWSGTESGVIATANALLAAIKPFYGTQWTLGLSRLYRYDPTTTRFLRLSPKPSVTPVTGTGSSNPSGATDPTLINLSIYTAPARLAPSDAHVGVGRFRLNLPGALLRPVQAHAADVTSGSSAGGLVTTADTTLIGYLSGLGTRVIAHNGGQPENEFTINVAPSERLRHSLGLA